MLVALNTLNYDAITDIIKSGMEDKNTGVRTTALSLLNNNNVSKESLPIIAKQVFTNGSIKEQQQLLVALCKMEADKTQVVLADLVEQYSNKKLSDNIFLELKEATNTNEALKTKLADLKTGNTFLDDYAEALSGGNRQNGYSLFNHNSTAQCVRCHNMGNEGGTMVGPALTHIGSILTREQILQALIEPSARLAPNFGTVSLKLDDGQEVTGVLAKESATELTLTTSDAEPLIVPISRIKKRENMSSSMPPMGDLLTKREIRDLVEFLTTMK
jgi:putative heme-binding domain-containing protein